MTDAPNTKRVIGVDGGGSKTIAWVADLVPGTNACRVELNPIGRGQAGPSNVRSVGFETAFANLSIAISDALQQASKFPASIESACLSLAGAGRVEEQTRIKAWFDQQSFAKRCTVVDDVEPLRLAAMYEHAQTEPSLASSWDTCITLVSGTGSIARGITNRGVASRFGGWGYLLGDEGSGFAIGLAGLRAICNASDRGAELSEFHREMLNYLELRSPAELVGFVYQSPLPRTEIAAVSELVIKHAEQHPDAAKIVRSAVREMVQLVTSTAERLELKHRSFALAMSGGILCNHPKIVSQLLSELDQHEMAPQSHHLVRQPIYGPLMMASAS